MTATIGNQIVRGVDTGVVVAGQYTYAQRRAVAVTDEGYIKTQEQSIVAAVDPAHSTYDGGTAFVAPATAGALQVKATEALAVASGAAVIDVGDYNRIRIWLACDAAVRVPTVCVWEFSETPAVGKLTNKVSVVFPTSDQGATSDQSNFGIGASGTEKYTKQPQYVCVTPGTKLLITLSVLAAGTAWARYTLERV
jgi:hypothetical protein